MNGIYIISPISTIHYDHNDIKDPEIFSDYDGTCG
jgi:hypothetical protein